MNSPFIHAEVQLDIERSHKYKGSAKIDIEDIGFHPDISQSVQQYNIDRLCKILQREGCRRLDAQNHVTAIISLPHLHAALQAAGKSFDALLGSDPNHFPHLRFLAGQVLCLHGRHRILAGAKVLPADDRWWTVDIYLGNISHELRTALTEGYFNEGQPSDGEIYRKIRRYQQEHNAFCQKMWWARLTEDKARHLRQLSNNIDICSAFDSLLPIPGLWGGMSLKDVGKVMALNCDEEIVHYLTLHLREFWVTLVSSDPNNPDFEAMMKIDAHTVETLELMAPSASCRDASKVEGLLGSGEVLSGFSLAERIRMWKWLRDYDGIIPSLRTFFRDIEYLNECAKAVKLLFNPSEDGPTVRQAMQYCYVPTDPIEEVCLIQTSDHAFERRFGSRNMRQELSYRQIWLYAMRYYPRILRMQTKCDSLANSQNKNSDGTEIYEMAMLAQKLGFWSSSIEKLITQSPDVLIAQNALLKARDQGWYKYDAKIFPTLVHRIVECFMMARPRQEPQTTGLLDFTADLTERCGLPSPHAQRHDRRLLFLDPLYIHRVPVTRTVSTWYVRRNIYLAFFGRFDNFLGSLEAHRVPALSTFPLGHGAIRMPSRISDQWIGIGAPWECTGSMVPIPLLGDTERRTEIVRPAPQQGKPDEEVFAETEAAEQSLLLREDDVLVEEQENFRTDTEGDSIEGIEPGHSPLEEGELELEKSPNISSPSFQLRSDLSTFVAKFRGSTSSMDDGLQQPAQTRIHTINQLVEARKRKNRSDNTSGTNKMPKSGRKEVHPRTRNMARDNYPSLDEAESIRFGLLRSLMSKVSKSFDDVTLRQIFEIGDRIINEINTVLNGWSEWLSREFQPSGVLLPPYHNLSTAEICIAACRLLASTDNSTHHSLIHRRLARVLLYHFVSELDKELMEREKKGEVFERNGRSTLTIVHDLIVENVGEFERKDKKWNRQDVVDNKNLGKRWWRLGSGIGIIAIPTCASDLVTSHMESRCFTDTSLKLLVNYLRNAYPSAVAHFQSLDPIIQPLFANVSLATNDVINLDPICLQFDALPQKVQWTDTESAMVTATENLLRRFRGD